MARIRSLKPEIWMSPQVMNLSHSARLLFIGLITQADDEGRGTADPRRLKASIFGGDDVTSASVRGWLDECSSNDLAVVYETDSHGLLYQLTGWKHHQRIDRPSKSAYPSPTSSNVRRKLIEDSSSTRRGSDGSDGSLGSDGSEGSTHSSNARRIVEGNGKHPELAEPDQDQFRTWFAQLRQNYPPGIYREGDWLHAEHLVHVHLETGYSQQVIGDGVGRFRAQSDAASNTGTQFVQSPLKFFAVPPAGQMPAFMEPFPLPAERPKKSTSMAERSNWKPPE